MKIRHPVLIRLAAWVIAWMVRLWIGTVRYRKMLLDPTVDPYAPGQKKRFIFAFWHETLLLPARVYRRTGASVLISQHADGEMIARACESLGMPAVRGSSTRGGIEAVRQIVKLGGKSHVVVTPDGPRGPRRKVQGGVVYLASKTGLPIVPVGFAFRRCWRMNSWDQFALPVPFTRGVGVLGKPISVPADLNREGMETYRLQVEQAMLELTEMAEEWAKTGTPPETKCS